VIARNGNLRFPPGFGKPHHIYINPNDKCCLDDDYYGWWV